MTAAPALTVGMPHDMAADDSLSTSTTQAATRTAPPASASLIERLPTELRLQIYDYLFPDKLVPSHVCDRGGLRIDGQPSSTKILRLNRAIHAEAEAVLYARTPFEVQIHPAGITLCGGRSMTHADFDFGKRGGPQRIFPTQGAWEPLLRNVRRLDLKITAWVQHSLFDIVRAYVAYFVGQLLALKAPLSDIRIAVDWQNGTTNFPVSHPTAELARTLLKPFARLRNMRQVRFGRIGPPRCIFGARIDSIAEDEDYLVLKDRLRDAMMGR